MRIDLSQHIPGTRDSEQPSQTSLRPSATGTGGEATGDATKLSWGRASVQALTASVHQLPEIRQERVAALTQMIQNRTYRVGAEQVAEALISHMTGRSVG